MKSKENAQIPKHVAIIPDGNRRWARSKNLIELKGHEKSAEKSNVISLIEEAFALKIDYVSIWGFSTENWKRKKIEVSFLFNLMMKVIRDLREYIAEKEIRFRHIGRKDRLPKKLALELELLEKETKNNNKLNLQIFLDYGGRDEIVRSVNKILNERRKKITEDEFSLYLDTYGLPDPDFIIRTSGELRLSGLMPFQSVYSELYFSEKNFPDFKAEDFRKAVFEFSERKRRFGGN